MPGSEHRCTVWTGLNEESQRHHRRSDDRTRISWSRVMYKSKGFDAIRGVPFLLWSAMCSFPSLQFLLLNSVTVLIQLKSVKSKCPLKVRSRKSS